MLQPQSCLIIGGGISGLIAGTVLQRNGIQVTVLDKGRGIGGRLATRRIQHPQVGEGVFDYGAQGFSVSDRQFQVWIDEWLEQGIITAWVNQFGADKRPYYRGQTSNRTIAQHLAKPLEIHTQTRATRIHWNTPGWTVQTEGGKDFSGDALIITAPVPQTLELLDRSAIALPLPIQSGLEAVTYDPCIAVLALLSQSSQIPQPGGLRLNGPGLSWIACNQQKGISPAATAITLHATPDFSQTHWDTDNAVVVEQLFKAAAPWLDTPSVDYQVHRWRYSQPKTVYGKPFLALEHPGLCLLAGDAFSTAIAADPALVLEKAVVSGLAAANHLLTV